MKYAAILGLVGLVSIATVTLTHKSQPSEPVISGSEIQTEGSIIVPEKSETKTETPTTPPSPKSLAFKLADLVVPKTEVEQDAAIDQNTIKNVEQDARLDNLETEIKCQNPSALNYQGTIPCVYPPVPPAPLPLPLPEPGPEATPTPAPAEPIFKAKYGGFPGQVHLANTGATVAIKSLKYQFFNGSLSEHKVTMRFISPHFPEIMLDSAPLAPDVFTTKEYTFTNQLSDLLLEIGGGGGVSSFRFVEVTYILNGVEKTAQINSQLF